MSNLISNLFLLFIIFFPGISMILIIELFLKKRWTSWDNEDKELQESTDAFEEKRKMHRDMMDRLHHIWDEAHNYFSGLQRDIEYNDNPMSDFQIAHADQIEDAEFEMVEYQQEQ